MKIGIIDNSTDMSGANNSIISSCAYISNKYKTEFIFVYPSGTKCIEKTQKAGFKCYEMPYVEIRKRIFNIVFYFPALLINTIKLNAIFKKEQIKTVHVNDIFNMCGICLKIFYRYRVIYHIRRMPETFPSVLYKFWAKMLKRFADKIIPVSVANKKAIGDSPNVEVIYNITPVEEKYEPFVLKEHFNNQVRLLYLANYIKGKGQNYAIEVLNRLTEKMPELFFLLNIYGGDSSLQKNKDYVKSLLEQAELYKLTDRVSINDKSDDVEQLIKQHDIIMNLSDSESLSRVTMESLFFGIPILATNVGGTGEMVIDKRTGMLVTKANVNEMEEALYYMVNNDAERIRMSKNGKQHIREVFSNDNSAKKLYDIYLSLNSAV
jgi:L-malate glycosyltransferase